jgi:hypothetical protein
MSQPVEIVLRGRGGVVRGITLVDPVDAEWASQLRWHLASTGYARRRDYRPGGDHEDVWLHRKVLRLANSDPRCVDHINRNRLDNRRENLRAVTAKENRQNTGLSSRSTTGLLNVSYQASRDSYVVQFHGLTLKEATVAAEAARLALSAVRSISDTKKRPPTASQ